MVDTLLAIAAALGVAGLGLRFRSSRGRALMREKASEVLPVFEEYQRLKRTEPVAAEQLMESYRLKVGARREELRAHVPSNAAAAAEFHRKTQHELADVQQLLHELRREAAERPEVGMTLASVESRTLQLQNDIAWSCRFLPS